MHRREPRGRPRASQPWSSAAAEQRCCRAAGGSGAAATATAAAAAHGSRSAALDRAGRLYVCNPSSGTLSRVDPRRGSVEVLARHPRLLRGAADVAVAPDRAGQAEDHPQGFPPGCRHADAGKHLGHDVRPFAPHRAIGAPHPQPPSRTPASSVTSSKPAATPLLRYRRFPLRTGGVSGR